MGQKTSDSLQLPQEKAPIKKKKTVMFTADTIDKNQMDPDELFAEANRDRSDYDSRKTYGDTDAMMKNRTDTIYKSKEQTEEQRKAALLGPAAKARAK